MLFIEVDRCRIGHRIITPHNLEEPTIAPILLLCSNYTIKRALFLAVTG
jgi:hypothetical protein